ncbi:MAG: hypothetical protein JOY68_03145 [Candidatus Dormibacteraeota bacterium]|nr:hypothetical protein [Candidatus Dormibacteraeota bacterium]
MVQPLVVLVGALLVLAAIAVFSARPPSDDSDPSSRSAGKLGSLALYTWLQRLGLDTERISGSFTLAATDVLVEYDPSVDFSPSEVATTRSFLDAGGEAIVAFGAEGVGSVQPLLQSLGVQLSSALPPGVATPAQPFDVASRVHAVPTSAGFALLEAPPVVPLLRQSSDVVLAGVQVGAGRVYVLGDTAPLSNDGLRDGDAAVLMLSLLDRARGGRVGFDEFHHGEGVSGTGAAAIFSGPMGAAAALAVVLAVVFLAINGRRLGRPLATSDAALPPSASAYVAAVAELFARSRRRGSVAAHYAAELKRHVGRVTGIDQQLDDDAFVAAAAASGFGDTASLDAVLRRARGLAAGHPDDASLLRLAQDSVDVEHQWSQSPQGTAQ